MELTFLPDNSVLAHFDAAARVINRFHWNLTVEEIDGEVRLRSGEGLIGRFASMAELEVFTAGMALALYVVPARRPRSRKRRGD